MSLRLLLPLYSLLGILSSLSFPPYQPSDSYKCGLYKKGRVEDRALGQYYAAIRQTVDWVSQPFPHQDLLSDGALLGDYAEWTESFENKYPQWLQFEQGVLVVVGVVLIFSVLFPLFYIIGRCLHACCSSQSEKKGYNSTDGPWDGCKRHSLNALLIVFVLIDVFAAAALLVTGQYAEYGMEELPGRLNQCIDDLNLYKRETHSQIRKLLIDDYRILNNSLVSQMDGSGALVVDRVKKVTGAHGIDVFRNISEEAKVIQSVLVDAKSQLEQVQGDASHFMVEFNRLKKSATTEINSCLQRENEHLKAMCRRAAELLSGFDNVDIALDASFLDNIDQSAVETFLLTNVSGVLESSNSQFTELGQKIQSEIDTRTVEAKTVLRKIGDDLFAIAEQVSARIRQINLDPLYAAVTSYTDGKDVNAMQIVRYSWYGSLVLTALFILLSLAFLFGLFYGLCGRRASYYNDDCCVRSTGSKFFGCGVWLSIFLYTALSICAIGLFVVFSNATNLICDPLENPLTRPDMITLSDRYLEMWRQQNSETEAASIISDRSVAELVRGCQRNETFYHILNMDAKYHLDELEARRQDHEKLALSQFDSALASMVNRVGIEDRMGNFLPPQLLQQLQLLRDVNVSQLSTDALSKIQSSINELDLMAKLRSFEESLPQNEGKPQAVAMLLVQVDAIDREIAAPLRSRLKSLHSNLTRLNNRLSELHVPVDSIISKLQHAQVLLSNDVRSHVVRAATEVVDQLKGACSDYIAHVKKEMSSEVSSCAPLAQTVVDSRDAFCQYTLDPVNGSWMSMFICLAVTFPIVLLCTILVPLYNRVHAYPKYVVHEPIHDHFVSSFITDTYDSRRKPMHSLPPPANYANYSFTGDFHTPYLR